MIFTNPLDVTKTFAGLMSRWMTPRRVRGGEALGDLRWRAREAASRRQRPLVEQGLEALALEELHRDEVVAVLFADVVDRADVRVVQDRRGARLALEALDGLLPVELLVDDELQRDVARRAGRPRPRRRRPCRPRRGPGERGSGRSSARSWLRRLSSRTRGPREVCRLSSYRPAFSRGTFPEKSEELMSRSAITVVSLLLVTRLATAQGAPPKETAPAGAPRPSIRPFRSSTPR